MPDRWPQPRVAVVTGASQGLGAAIVARLARKLGPESTVYLTARTAPASEELSRIQQSGSAAVTFAPLDVCNAEDVDGICDLVQERHGGVDIVVSNATAHFSRERPQVEDVAAFIDTNNLALTRLMRSFNALLRPNARFVVMSSSFGRLDGKFETSHPRLRVFAETFGSNWSFSGAQASRLANNSLGLDDIDAIMSDYVRDVVGGIASRNGWPDWINVPSKAGQIAAVRAYARALRRSASRGILVNAVDPGFTDTGGARSFGLDVSTARSASESAALACWPMLVPPGAAGPQGQLIRDREIVPWP